MDSATLHWVPKLCQGSTFHSLEAVMCSSLYAFSIMMGSRLPLLFKTCPRIMLHMRQRRRTRCRGSPL